VDYLRSKPGADVGKLHAELAAAALPVTSVRGPDAEGNIVVTMSRELDPMEVGGMDAVIDMHDGRKRKPRVLYAIWQDIGALSGSQKNNIATDLFGGTPPKVSQDTGPNAPVLLTLSDLQKMAALSTADKQSAQRSAISIFTLDNPTYLVHPPFDPSINVPGDELA